MNEDIFVPFIIFGFIALIVWINVSARTRFKERVLTTIEKAIERGVDPSTLPLSVLPANRDRLAYWKTGIILIGVGIAIIPLMVMAFYMEPDAVPALSVPLIPIILGVFFLLIHKRVDAEEGKSEKNGITKG
jgi:hypothetical protein